MALMSEIHQVHRGTNQQDVSKYVNSLMSLGRHLQLQEFRTWLNDKCGLPVAVRPSDVHLAEYMDKEQIEAWINEWTQNHATDRSGKIFRLFLQHEFQVDVKDSMQLCSGCAQPYSSFLLMPMRAYKTGTYDPLDYHLFCYTCCTSTSGLLSPGHWLRDHPKQQAHQRRLAMTAWSAAPSSQSWQECELRAIGADRGYIPPTWYLAVPPDRVPTPDQAIILHTWDEDTRRWIKLPMTKSNETQKATQYTPCRSGNNWYTACTNHASSLPRQSFSLVPERPPTKDSRKPSNKLTRPLVVDKPNDNSLNTRNFWPPPPAPTFGLWTPTTWQRSWQPLKVGKTSMVTLPSQARSLWSATSSPLTAPPISRTSWTLSRRTCTNTTFVETPSVAS